MKPSIVKSYVRGKLTKCLKKMKIINGTKLKLNMILKFDDKIKHCVIGK